MTFSLYTTQCSIIDRAQGPEFVVGAIYNCGNSGGYQSRGIVERLIADVAVSFFMIKQSPYKGWN